MADRTDELTIALQRFPLRDWVQECGGGPAGKDEYLLTCPRCGRDKLSVNVERKRWRCFICEEYHQLLDPRGHKMALDGAGGIFSLVVWMLGCQPREAAQLIIERAAQVDQGPDLPLLEMPGVQIVKQPTGLPANALALDGVLPYMSRRGITLDDAQQFGLRWVPSWDGGWLANRLIFPVWERGACLYWQGRACWDAHEHRPRWEGKNAKGEEDKFRKSLNPSAERHGVHYFGSSDVLLNLEQAARYPRVAITEGPTSCIRTGVDAVATFGKQLSPQQVGRLVQAGVRGVDFMWDGPGPTEPAGAWPQMFQSAALLAPYMDVRLVFLPAGDPGDYTRQQLAWFRSQARPYGGAQFLW